MDITEILSEIDFETWLDHEGIAYRKTVGKHGREFNIRECPVCGGNEWKVYINARTNLGVCFHGSHPTDMQFNKWRFISQSVSLGGRDFQHYLEDVHHSLGHAPVICIEPESAETTITDVELPSHDVFVETEPLPLYLARRGVSHALAKYFDLRMAVGQHMYWDETDAMFRSQDFSERILIPIYDLKGELKTFQGRDITGDAEKKYLFPAALPASGRYLYNGHNAIGKETIIVGEGAFDVLGIKRALLDEPVLASAIEPVGTFGMSLSGGVATTAQDQIGEFLTLRCHGLKTIVMMWDTEDKTITHLLDAVNRLQQLGFIVKIAVLPNGFDPGDAPKQAIIDAYFRAKLVNQRLKMRLKMRGFSALLS